MIILTVLAIVGLAFSWAAIKEVDERKKGGNRP